MNTPSDAAGIKPADTRSVSPRSSLPLVRDVMSRVTVTATPRDNLEHIAKMLTEHDVNSLPVIDLGICVGIVSRSDIVRVLAERGGSVHEPKTPDDDRIRFQVIDTLVAMPGGSPWLTDVAVHGGLVILDGLLEDDTMRSPTCEAIASIDGVEEIVDSRHNIATMT